MNAAAIHHCRQHHRDASVGRLRPATATKTRSASLRSPMEHSEDVSTRRISRKELPRNLLMGDIVPFSKKERVPDRPPTQPGTSLAFQPTETVLQREHQRSNSPNRRRVESVSTLLRDYEEHEYGVPSRPQSGSAASIRRALLATAKSNPRLGGVRFVRDRGHVTAVLSGRSASSLRGKLEEATKAESLAREISRMKSSYQDAFVVPDYAVVGSASRSARAHAAAMRTKTNIGPPATFLTRDEHFVTTNDVAYRMGIAPPVSTTQQRQQLAWSPSPPHGKASSPSPTHPAQEYPTGFHNPNIHAQLSRRKKGLHF